MKRVSPGPAPVIRQSLCMCSIVSCPRDLVLQGNTLLGGSWVVISGDISPMLTLLMTPPYGYP